MGSFLAILHTVNDTRPMSALRRRARPARLGAALPTLYLRQVAEQLQSAGVSVADWLAASGQRPAILSETSAEVPEPVFRRLVADAIARTREPALGLLVGARMLPSHHGLVGQAALSGRTVEDTLLLIEQFLALRTTLVRARIRRNGDAVRLELIESRPLRTIRGPILEAVALALKNLLDAAAVGRSPVASVRFPGAPPTHAVLARTLFACPIRWDSAQAALCFSARDIERPLPRGTAESFAAATAACARELERLESEQGTAAAVERLLLGQRAGFPSLATTARMLHLSARTLHRRLAAEGTSWRTLIERVRMQLAMAHLKEGHLTVARVAALLGYTDVANFRRAYRRWTGSPPGRPAPVKDPPV